MTTDAKYRRTWPQRFLIVAGFVLAGTAAFSATRLESVHDVVEEIVRVDVPFDVLAEPVEEGDPINILIIGTDSAAGLDPDDPVNAFRDEENLEPRADVIMVLRLDPRSGEASIVSIPRDLYLPISGVNREYKISSALIIGDGIGQGITHVVETVRDQFEIEIHNFLIVDFLGFQELVEAIDGVPVWFDRPTVDGGSGLNIAEAPACHTLDGAQALAYVRGRKFEEYDFERDRWVAAQRSDLFRVKRQQDFLVLALERAIDKGARDLLFQNTLIEAGSQAVTLDDQLTVNQLLDLGRAFADFNPDTLDRLSLDAYLSDDTVPQGGIDISILRVNLEAAKPVFDVFRGFDTVTPPDVAISIAEGRLLDEPEEVTVAGHLVNKDFEVLETVELETEADETTIRFREADRDAADLLARFLKIPPAFEVADDIAENASVELVVADDYEGFLLFPRQTNDDFEEALNEVAPTTTRSDDDESTTEPPTTTTIVESDDGATTTATQAADVTTTVTTTTVGVVGRAPEGVDCQ